MMENEMLKDFLRQNEDAILMLTEQKTLELAGDHPSSDLLKRGLPSFYRQIIEVLPCADSSAASPTKDVGTIARAADRSDEPAMAIAAGQPRAAELARSAGLHGLEMLRLGYSLSHVVHAYGAMCQAITETADEKRASITVKEFHALNGCLDIAIAGAVTDYQSRKDSEDPGLEGRRVAKDMHGTLVRVKAAFEAIQQGLVGTGGETSRTLAGSLGQLESLIDRSLVASDAARFRGGTA
jgi:hypothetical protein